MADTSLNENRIGLLIWQTSNVWQSKIRSKITNFGISFNEYIILETIFNLSKISSNITQVDISRHSFINKSVISTKLIQLYKKKYIKKLKPSDNRSNNLELSEDGSVLIEQIIIEVKKIERDFFDKLNQETFNFKNSLKLLLGKKIRIKANYNE